VRAKDVVMAGRGRVLNDVIDCVGVQPDRHAVVDIDAAADAMADPRLLVSARRGVPTDADAMQGNIGRAHPNEIAPGVKSAPEAIAANGIAVAPLRQAPINCARSERDGVGSRARAVFYAHAAPLGRPPGAAETTVGGVRGDGRICDRYIAGA